MAESSNKQSIEDVLSSIRRLVSDEGESKAKAAAPEAALSDRLVLTPQFRVTEPEDPYQTIRALTQAEAPTTDEDEPSLEDAPDADVLMPVFTSEQRGSTAFASEPAMDASAKLSEQSDDVVDVTVEDVVDEEAPLADLSLTESPVDVPTESDVTDEVGLDEGPSLEGASVEASIETDATVDEMDLEAITAEAADTIVPETEVSSVVPVYEPVPEILTLNEAAMDEPFETAEPAEVAPMVAEEATDVVSQVPQDAVPMIEDAPEPLASSEEDVHASGHQSTQAIPFPQDKIARDVDPVDATPAPYDGDDVLDEETLREIIADVVREEFAGQLGERITRNVRKLVRREIRQMLASEDLE